jgi:glycine/D-amino acid oxidase-like deaminating enzyme
VDTLKEHLLRCQVLHADETPGAQLDPGSGKTHPAYLWAYAAAASDPLKAVVYDLTRAQRLTDKPCRAWRCSCARPVDRAHSDVGQ